MFHFYDLHADEHFCFYVEFYDTVNVLLFSYVTLSRMPYFLILSILQ